MSAIMVRLTCITNLHVGNGEANLGLIDREVERDPVTGYPTINSSGIKGALREHFLSLGEENFVKEAFGADAKDPNGTSQGRLKFISADFVARPARASKGARSYYLVTTKDALDRYEQMAQTFLGDKKAAEVTPDKTDPKAAVEGNALPKSGYALGGFGPDKGGSVVAYTLDEKTFDSIMLPVYARNNLDNGRSTNLWYEQVVPHESLFAFVVLASDEGQPLLDRLKGEIDNKVLQFGANASIGYGLCRASVRE